VAVGDLQKTVGRNLRVGGVERGERNLTLKSLERMAEQIGVEALTLLQR